MGAPTTPCKQPSPSITAVWVLQQILCVIQNFVTAFSTGTGNVTPAWTVYDDDGATTVGIHSVEFQPDEDFVGTIDGVPYTGADWLVVGPFKAPVGKGLGAIAFTVTAGTLTTIEIPLA